MPQEKLTTRERNIYRAALLILLLATLGSVLATTLHALEESPQTMDLVIPPVMAAGFLLLLVILIRNPSGVASVLRWTFLFPVLGIAIPAWYFSIEAALNPELRLTVTLPPVVTVLFPVMVGIVLFLRPRDVFPAALTAWLSVALPILGYLALYPAEIITPRGEDLLIGLLPAMGVMLVLLYFYVDIRRHVFSLQMESSNLRTLADHDSLTGLLNRRAGEQLLREILESSNRPDISAIQLDIDHFKRVNDTFGHSVGDEVIREIVARCMARMRRGDFFIRWGGEEFLIILQGANAEDGQVLAEKLRQEIAAMPIGKVGQVTVSFDVTQLAADDTIDSFLKRGDDALYAAKDAGRDTVIVR